MDKRKRDKNSSRRSIMKIEILFEKVEDFFEMGKKKQKKNTKQKDKLVSKLLEKITSKKEKLKNTKNKDKKEQLKKELTILKKLEKDLEDIL